MNATKSIRNQSQEQAQKLGYTINEDLPLLDVPSSLRPLSEVTDRLLCVLSIVASSYGFPKFKACAWLSNEELESALSPSENIFLKTKPDQQADTKLQWRVEALWSLAWCTKVHDELNFSKKCSDAFVSMLPDLAKAEAAGPLRDKMVMRDVSDIFQAADLAYCLHWAVRDAQINGRPVPGHLQPEVIVQRRYALDWILGEEDWDEVSLDT